jgi:hypothetical protein
LPTTGAGGRIEFPLRSDHSFFSALAEEKLALRCTQPQGLAQPGGLAQGASITDFTRHSDERFAIAPRP